ncbi:MAG: hypothetical protein RIS35_20 [Pseudomonadota bacterium]|jgi:regulatory protein
MVRAGRGPSLKARAIGLLASREQSPVELRRKLAPHAESEAQLDALLDELRQQGYLSEQRFVESLIQRRAGRYGRRRIQQELEGHRVSSEVGAPLMRVLAETERERAYAAWQKRFGRLPSDLAERGRQHRFLAQRGFDAEVIAWVFRHARDDSANDG